MKLKRMFKKIVKPLVFLILICLVQTQIKITTVAQTVNSSSFILNLYTDNESYEKGQCIKIFGNITNISDEVNIFDKIKITLKNGDWERFITTNLKNNAFEYFYNISFGDPEGFWNITVEVELENKDTVYCYKNVNVSLPSDVIRYKVVWFSPSNEAVYFRGSSFDISVYVTEDEKGVTNATVKCILPNLEKIELSEIKPGYYMFSYFIPWDCDVGLWSLSVDCVKGAGTSLAAGGSNILINVQPVMLKLVIVNDSKDVYNLGELVHFMVDLRYPDDQVVENATVKLKVAGEDLFLNSEGNGFYFVDCSNIFSNTGGYFIEFFASDAFGNSASATKIIYIVGNENSGFSFYLFLVFVFIFIICFLFIIFIKKRFLVLRLNDIENEIEEIKRLQKENVVNYYVKGLITRETYEMLRRDFSKRLSELGKKHPKKD